MTVRCFLAAVLAVAGLLPASPLAAPEPVWPLDLEPRHLTSNFMERRPGRYHAGLDLKTRSRTGFAVRAVEDGHVSRVRAEAGAYGRAVYVTGVSGRNTVYAHLECFSDRIEALVRADRERSGVYRVRLEPGPQALPVRAGEVLGLSGQSGTDGPHLHFEVRDAAQQPLNPLDWGFAVADTFAPVIAAVTAHAAAPPNAGAPVAVAVRNAAGLAGTLPPLEIRGPVAFSARVTDRADIAAHVLEPWLLEVFLDGEAVYRRRNESFGFGDNNQLRLEWCDIADANGRTLLREQWLFRRDGVTVPGREGGPWHLGPGGRGLAPGDHLLEIVATDRAGGRAAVTVPLRVLPAGPQVE
ncbi:MAG: M23 family metallopeptidase, partial [Krumholzibacteria bacterium]|nr:M23 family metallopeptidase [Candidatus Krumholzibacteria bacterium]